MFVGVNGLIAVGEGCDATGAFLRGGVDRLWVIESGVSKDRTGEGYDSLMPEESTKRQAAKWFSPTSLSGGSC